MSDSEVQKIIEYIRRFIRNGGDPRDLLGLLTREFGQAGELAGIVAEIFADQQGLSSKDLSETADLLERSKQDTPVEAQVLPRISAPHIDDKSSADILSQLIETPTSSNVFGFGYDHQNKILYVQFKAPGETTHSTGQVNQCNGRPYKMGHRPHVPGPIYAYGSAARPVPESLFDEMLLARSTGEFIWDKLRICGSIHGHQYPYILVSPFMANGKAYVPRKATRHGFRVRTVPTVGQGRRPFQRSNLRGYNESRVNRVGRPGSP